MSDKETKPFGNSSQKGNGKQLQKSAGVQGRIKKEGNLIPKPDSPQDARKTGAHKKSGK